MTSFGHSKPCQKTMYIYASLSLIISLIKLMSINYAYNNKKNLTWIFMKGTGCYSTHQPQTTTTTATANQETALATNTLTTKKGRNPPSQNTTAVTNTIPTATNNIPTPKSH